MWLSGLGAAREAELGVLAGREAGRVGGLRGWRDRGFAGGNAG